MPRTQQQSPEPWRATLWRVPPIRQPRSQGQARRPHRLRLAAFVLLSGLAGAVSAIDLDAQTEQLLVEAVEAAANLDLYNARCRGDISGRAIDNLNKLMVGKLRTTVLSVQDDLFPEHSYRRAQQRLEADFLARLREMNGCAGAKDSGLPQRLKDVYQEKLGAIRALP